jgi:hypothetical protein
VCGSMCENISATGTRLYTLWMRRATPLDTPLKVEFSQSNVDQRELCITSGGTTVDGSVPAVFHNGAARTITHTTGFFLPKMARTGNEILDSLHLIDTASASFI